MTTKADSFVLSALCLALVLAAPAASLADPGSPALTGTIVASEAVPAPSSVAVARRHLGEVVVTTSSATNQLLTHRLVGDKLVPLDAKPTGLTPLAVAIARHGQYAVTANSNSDDLSVHHIDANGVLTQVGDNVPSGGDNPFDVVAFEDLVVVANRDSDSVTLFGMNRKGELASRGTFPAGVDPHVITVGPQGTIAVANSTSNDLTIFDLDGNGNMTLVEEAFSVGGSPRALTFNENGDALFVAVRITPGAEDRIRGYSVSRPTPDTIEFVLQSDTPAGFFATDMLIGGGKLLVPTVNGALANEMRSYAVLDNAQIALEDVLPLPGPTSFKKAAAGTRLGAIRSAGQMVFLNEFQAGVLLGVRYRNAP